MCVLHTCIPEAEFISVDLNMLFIFKEHTRENLAFIILETI